MNPTIFSAANDRRAATPFDPDSISGLVARWWPGGWGLADAASVVTFEDVKGSHDGTQADSGKRVTKETGSNGRACARFPGTDKQYDVADHADLKTNDITLYCVADFEDTTVWQVLFVKSSASWSPTGYGIIRHSSGTIRGWKNNYNAISEYAESAAIETPVIIVARFKSTGESDLWLNGTKASTASGSTVGHGTHVLSIGNHAGGAPFEGDFYDGGQYDVALTDGEIEDTLTVGLAAYYGISL